MVTKKAAYVKGLLEGLDIDKHTKEGKLLTKIVDLFEDVCEEVDRLKEDVCEMEQAIDDMDQDLNDLEDYVFSDEYDDKYDFDDCFCVKCPNCGEEHYMKYSDLNEDELESGEIKCPSCKAKINLDECLVFNENEDDYCDCGCGKADCDCDDGKCNCDK